MNEENTTNLVDTEVSTSANESEVATPVEEVETTPTDVNVPEETPKEEKPTVDVNAIAASIRRKAEAEAKARQEKIDAEYVRRFGSFKNPITGKPISSQADYLEALDAQEKLKAENELREKGVNPDLIQRMVENSPAVREANAYMEKVKKDEAQKQIDEDVAALSQLDSSIDSFEKVPKEVVEMCMKIEGLRLVDAYKILNYDKAQNKNADAIRQQAVNQIKGKSHMTPMTGVANNNAEVEIPLNERSLWEAMFPNKTYAEMRKLYNKQIGD